MSAPENQSDRPDQPQNDRSDRTVGARRSHEMDGAAQHPDGDRRSGTAVDTPSESRDDWRTDIGDEAPDVGRIGGKDDADRVAVGGAARRRTAERCYHCTACGRPSTSFQTPCQSCGGTVFRRSVATSRETIYAPETVAIGVLTTLTARLNPYVPR